MLNSRWVACMVAVGCLGGCAGEVPQYADYDAGGPSAPDVAAHERDASVAPTDRGAAEDSPFTVSLDTNPPDPTPVDAGRLDTGAVDTGVRDTGVRDTGVRDTGVVTDTGPRDTGVAADVGTLPSVGPALPAWDGATIAHVREVRDRGVAMGNRLNVFAKIGDSITESGSFLSDIGFGWGQMGTYTALNPTIQFFRARSFGGDMNSFNRYSVCATAGWSTDDALDGGTSAPLRRELAAIHPSWAIVMYGTNDIDRNSLAAYRTNMNRILDIIEEAGTVPAISTVPDRLDGSRPAALVPMFNAAIREIAAARHIPLIDYWASLQTLPRHGVSSDDIHPSVLIADGSTQGAYFTSAGLMYGYNMRNLTAVQMLDRMRTLP